MNKKLLSSLVLLALTAPTVALADDSPISGNVALTTDYIFRGVSQTGGEAAIQGGLDYARDSGFYTGVWASNVSSLGLANSSFEIDTYVGFSNEISDGISYDVGLLHYEYPGTYAAGANKPNTDEIYGGVSYMGVTAKYSYSLTDLFGTIDSKGSDYIELNGDYSLDNGIDLSAHYGRQNYGGAAANAANDYTDYSLGVSKSFFGLDVSLTHSDTNIAAQNSTTTLTVSRSL
jgi:uncharacterized protein (TIGR02001 family)